MSIPTVAEVKKSNTGLLFPSRSSAIANTSDGVQNVIANLDYRVQSTGMSIDHRAQWYSGAIPPTTADYAGAPIGSLYFEFKCDTTQSTTAPYDSAIWEKTIAGWTRISGLNRIRTIKTFGSTDSQFDVTLQGNSIVRYTYDGGGTAPTFAASGLKIGDKVTIGSGDFAAGNQGTFTVVTVAATYIEVYNASGVAESNIVTDGAPITSYLTLGLEDEIVTVANTAATTVVLPAAAGITGKRFTIRSSAAGIVTVDGNASETIGGLATARIFGTNQYMTIVSNGANWDVIASSGCDSVYSISGNFDNLTMKIGQVPRTGIVKRVTYCTSAAAGSAVGIDIIDGAANGSGTDVICACADNLNGVEVDNPTSANVLDADDYLVVKFDDLTGTAALWSSVNVLFRAGCEV
jgi:hypothetical protein